MGDITIMIERTIQRSNYLRSTPFAPFALPTLMSRPDIPSLLNWRALLTGFTIDPLQPNEPPSLDFDKSQTEHLERLGTIGCPITFEFDVDSVIFLASDLGVFRHDVEWSFRPSYIRAKQQNQYIKFPGVDLTKDKCILACSDGRWNCHIFFSKMPSSYASMDGNVVHSNSQHLDDYAMQIWTDRILLPALSAVCSNGRRHHYPFTFQEVQTKSNVKSEISIDDATSTRVDTRVPIASHLLHPLWEKILEFSSDVPDTQLPRDAFSDLRIVVSNHSMKLSGIGKTSFSQVRRAFMKDFDYRWDNEFIDTEHFWVDLGFERFSSGPTGTTVLRKQSCNRRWADMLRDPVTRLPDSIEVTEYPWAGTYAGSIMVNTKPHNRLRIGGLGPCKAYNVIKEQYASQMKGHHLFQDPGLEALAYSEEHLLSLGTKRKGQGRWPSKLSRPILCRHLQNAKNRTVAPLKSTKHCDFGDRQEWRLRLHLFLALPEQLSTELETEYAEAASWPETSHSNYWLLSTLDVNKFRLAEANRWLVALECVIAAAAPESGTSKVLPLAQQELNSLVATAMARLLRLSLGCLNPALFPSLWLGKRWVKSRFSNSFRHNTLQHTPTFQRRQGLNLGESVRQHGMMWIPPELGIWEAQVPTFRVARYPHLEINVNMIRASLGVSSSTLKAMTKEARIREFTRNRALALSTLHYAHDPEFKAFCVVLVQMCVQSYNLALWAEVQERWLTQASPEDTTVAAFDQVCKRTQLSQSGLEVISFDSLDTYLGKTGLAAIDMFNISFAKKRSNSTHFPSWHDHSWAGRVAPLFRCARLQPNWAKNTLYVRKYDEIVTILIEQCANGLSPAADYLQTFERSIPSIAGRYMQAILHYDYDKGITVAKSSKHNSQATQDMRNTNTLLSRTKWVFPRFANQDISKYAINNGTTVRKDISADEAIMIATRLQVLTEPDRKYKATSTTISAGYPPRPMLYRGSNVGLPDKMVQLISYIDEAETWISEEMSRTLCTSTSDVESETDWPPHPETEQVSDRTDMSDTDVDFLSD